MDTLFNGYDWSGLHLLRVERTLVTVPGDVYTTEGCTQFYQLGVKFRGKTAVNYNGKLYDYSDATVLYLPKETERGIPYERFIEKEGEGACIFFDGSGIENLPKAPVTLKYTSEALVEERFLKLSNLFRDGDTLSALSEFYGLLSLLKSEEEKSAGERSSARDFSEVSEYIDKHISDEYIDLEALAMTAGMSAEYFRHSFKAHFGVPPHVYIARKKCRLAEVLLADHSLSVKDAASAAGFSDPNYFARFFKKHTGVSPRDYRAMLRT